MPEKVCERRGAWLIRRGLSNVFLGLVMCYVAPVAAGLLVTTGLLTGFGMVTAGAGLGYGLPLLMHGKQYPPVLLNELKALHRIQAYLCSMQQDASHKKMLKHVRTILACARGVPKKSRPLPGFIQYMVQSLLPNSIKDTFLTTASMSVFTYDWLFYSTYYFSAIRDFSADDKIQLKKTWLDEIGIKTQTVDQIVPYDNRF